MAALHADAVVVGSDQVVDFEGRVFGKPGNAEDATGQLLAMSGKAHEIVTAVSVIHPDGICDYLDATVLWMRSLERSEIERYVAADEPWDCAGSYKLEARGITLFERIDSDDQTSVVGLPLIALTTILRGLGFSIP